MDPVTAISLASNVLGAIDLSIRYGKLLLEKINVYRHAEATISDMMLEVESFFYKMETQLGHLRQVWGQLSKSHQQLQSRLIQELNTKLFGAITKFGELMGQDGTIKKLKFAFSGKEYLSRTMEDLKKWYSHFDPSYILIGLMSTRIANSESIYTGAQSNVDGVLLQIEQLGVTNPTSSQRGGNIEQLRYTIKSPDETDSQLSFMLESEVLPDASTIAHSSSRLGLLHKSEQPVILDSVFAGSREEAERVTKGVCELAQLLRTVDPLRFGLLSCCGVIKILETNLGSTSATPPTERVARFDFVFAVPKSLREPRSLREIMLLGGSRTPLNELLTITKLLARSVFFIHTKRFVHKNIRPENILVFDEQENHVRRPFLIGFERFRADGTHSMKCGDGLWERDLYRHTSRQGLHPEQYFIMQHDIYSLGVVMLEIGLKTSFVIPANVGTSSKSTLPGPGELLSLSGTLVAEKTSRRRASSLKNQLINLAKEQLPAKMGQLYAEVVLSCLTCLDEHNESFGDRSVEDKDGIEVGVHYIEKIITRLDEITI